MFEWKRRLLQPLEFDERLPIAQHRLQFVVLRAGEIALRLHHEVVCGHADFELALLRLEGPLRQLARCLSGLHPLDVASHVVAALVTSVAICSSICFNCASTWFCCTRARATFASCGLVPIG